MVKSMDQGTLILRSDIFYQSAKLESPDLPKRSNTFVQMLLPPCG